MFTRRKKNDPTDAGSRASTPVTEGGKGRPTPSRKQAEAERKQRLKAAAEGDRKAQRREAAAARAATRNRIVAGDEQVLAGRDRGPVRKLARNLVDERRTVGEYFLFLAIGVLVIGLVPAFALFSQFLLIGVIFALVFDSYRTHRRVMGVIRERFPDEDLSGVGRYTVMRAMVTRRMRVPAPQVKPGSGRDAA
jgi:hypothetical protein